MCSWVFLFPFKCVLKTRMSHVIIDRMQENKYILCSVLIYTEQLNLLQLVSLIALFTT